MDFFELLAEPEGEETKQGAEDNDLVPVLEDGFCEVAIDNSGSTWSPLPSGRSVLAASKSLVASIWGDDLKVIAWNNVAERRVLGRMEPEGGTSPSCIFPLLREDKSRACKTLFITTDGAIDSEEVTKLREDVTRSGLVNVVAVYVSASEKPADLNLPVFAPFMFGVFGRVAILHWDGDSLRLLLKQCKGDPSAPDEALPEPPLEIGPESCWEDFPIVQPKDLRNMSLPRRVEARNALWQAAAEASPLVVVGGRSFSLDRVGVAVAEKLESLPADDPELRGFLDRIADFLEEAVGEVLNRTQSRLFRKILGLWHVRALEWSTNRLTQLRGEEPGMQQSRRRADELYQLLNQEQDPARRRPIQRELAEITTQLFHSEDQHRRAVQQASRAVEARYNALASRLAGGDHHTDYSLQSLSKALNSNRARRAKGAQAQSYDEATWEFDGAHQVECDICAETKPQGLLACAIPDDVIASNTSDAALNDAFSLGSKNRTYLPNSSLCVFCASFLASSGAPCPYSRQKIATVLPIVKYSKVSAAKLAANVSHWLFQGKELGIELQALLAVFDDVRGRGWSGVEALDFWEVEYVPKIRVNFQGAGYPSKPLLEAISDLFQAEGRGFEKLEGLLVPLRNKSLVSISALARLGMRRGSLRLENVADVVNRMLFKTVVGRVLGWCKDRENRKHEIVERLPRMLESDLYDTPSGFPVKGTGRVLGSVAGSRFLRAVFGMKGFEGLLRILGQESATVVGVSLEMLTVLMYSLLTDLNHQNYHHATEAFIADLAGKHPLVWKAFASPRAIGKEEVLELVAQLNQHVGSIQERVHKEVVPCFSPAHMLSPAVICCGSCGLAFIHPEEIRDYLVASPEAKDRMADAVKSRRCQHFRSVFCTDSLTGMVNLTSGHSNRHRAVSTILRPLLEPLDSSPKLPTRDMLLQALAYFRRFPKGGQLYGPHLLSHIVACMFDYLEQSSRLHEQGDFPSSLAGNHNVSFADRLSAEIAYLDRKKLLPTADGDQAQHWLKVFSPLSLQSLDRDLVEELTEPVSVDELLQVTYQPPAKRQRRDTEAPKPVEPVDGARKTFEKKIKPVVGISKTIQKKIKRRLRQQRIAG